MKALVFRLVFICLMCTSWTQVFASEPPRALGTSQIKTISSPRCTQLSIYTPMRKHKPCSVMVVCLVFRLYRQCCLAQWHCKLYENQHH